MSKDWSRHESVRQYLKRICGHIKVKDVHKEIRLEMTNHLDERVEDMVQDGFSEEEAVQLALGQMGDPDQIGRQLHAAHKPVFEWSLAVLVAILLGIGLVAMYAMKFALSDDYGLGEGYFPRQSLYVAVGVLLLIGIYFMDYRKLKKFSWYLYGFTVVIMFITSQIGIGMNGNKHWLVFGPFTLDIFAISSYLFMIAIAGTLVSNKEKAAGSFMEWLAIGKMATLYFLIPVWLYAVNYALVSFIVYGFGVMAIILFVSRNYKLLLTGLVLFAAGGLAFLKLNVSYYYMLLDRLQAYLHPYSNPNGYHTLKVLESIQSAGMWGQGFGVENKMFRYIHSEMIFTYLIYSLGWVFGAAMVALVLLFAVKVISVSRKLRDPYAKGLVVGLFSVIGFHYLWNMLMSVGLLPITGMTMPFISYGGTQTIMEIAAIGVILSVYRRKNMLGRASAESTGS
ncbi:FtsW/RodA/SpoVE family cell cycle protein [Paenibacillus harenae]|uniref:FtsW/RodA/SpoVE family cell cycle protein n=1 Tax=Paenibacillus harenae TaxID=306543 RepID=UPI000402716D|nr:FtsW/RodA/SpoVE family cell cycle protein [Paenibacillus harenae]